MRVIAVSGCRISRANQYLSDREITYLLRDIDRKRDTADMRSEAKQRERREKRQKRKQERQEKGSLILFPKRKEINKEKKEKREQRERPTESALAVGSCMRACMYAYRLYRRIVQRIYGAKIAKSSGEQTERSERSMDSFREVLEVEADYLTVDY